MKENRLRGDGSWSKRVINGIEYISYVKYVGATRKKKVEVYGKTEKECFRKMKKEQDHIEEVTAAGSSRLPSQNKTQLQDAMQGWMLTYKKGSMKPRSYDRLVGTYNAHIKGTVLGRSEIRNITKDDIMIHLNGIDRAYSTVKKVYELLNMFFRYYFASVPNASPMLGVVKPVREQVITMDEDGLVDTGEMVVLSDAEMDALDREVALEHWSIAYMLSFAMWSFMRLGEIQALQMKDIDLEKGTVNVYKSYCRARNDEGRYEWCLVPPKTKKSKRVVKLCPKAVNALKSHLRLLKTKRIDVLNGAEEVSPETFIFNTLEGNPYAAQNINDVLTGALKRAGINKKISFHGLRHTGISYFLRHGADLKTISALAGHSNVATTANIYYNIVREQIDSVYLKEYWEAG